MTEHRETDLLGAVFAIGPTHADAARAPCDETGVEAPMTIVQGMRALSAAVDRSADQLPDGRRGGK